MSLKYTWRGKELDSLFQKAALTALSAISSQFVDLCREAVDTPYPPASLPGQPPHRRTGVGQESIVSQTDVASLTSRLVVRPKGFYMILLEYGTHRTLPRPWLLPTLLRHHLELEDLGNRRFSQVMRSG